MTFLDILLIIIAFMCSVLIAFTMTPLARVLAYKIGAIDVPKDKRRMHRVEMPLLGGVAIFVSFVITVLAFCDISKPIIGLLCGSLFIVVTGILDDKFSLNPFLKLFLQIVAALIICLSGTTITKIGIPADHPIELGVWSVPFTAFWIVAMTNAVNLIDGLDGLSCGVSAISALSLLISSFFMVDTPYFAIMLTAILAGSCIGFLPFNFNPAKIFMGDTGAMFLGFSLSVISILGIYKTAAVYSFWVPFIAFALPLGDTAFAFMRRILSGRSPFSADRGHIHHRLIDMGFNQKQSVTILYAISAIFGISSTLFAIGRPWGGIVVVVAAFVILYINWRFLTKSDTTRQETGLGLSHIETNTIANDESATFTRSDIANAEKSEHNTEEEK